MKKFLTLSLILCICFLGYSQNERVNNIGKSGLISFLNDIPRGYLKEHGFNNVSEFAKAKIGSQYKIMALGKDGSLSPTAHYYLAITVDGENRSLLTIGELDGKLDIQGVGYSALAKELQQVEQSNRSNNKLANAMIIDYNNKSGYVSYVSDVNSRVLKSADLIPLESAKMFLGGENVRFKSSFKLAELVEINKAANSN